MLALKRIIPLINCNFGLSVQTSCFLQKKNIIGKIKTTVKKYLAHVIWSIGKSELKNLAKPSIIGSTTQADKLRIIALIKKIIY
tara:strand:+ start:21 stop:272 length:252 start_codon:yes stop_codon:yes gene_type:complete